MFCQYCGTKLQDNAKFCSSCGAKVETSNNIVDFTDALSGEVVETDNKMSHKKSGFAIAGFVLGLVSLLVDVYLGLPCAILGIVFSSLGKKSVKTKGLRGKKLANAGFVLSIISLCFIAITILLFLNFNISFDPNFIINKRLLF